MLSNEDGSSYFPGRALDLQRKARQKEIQGVFRSFLLSALLTLPFLVQMCSRLLGSSIALPFFLQAVLAAIIQFGSGWRFYQASYQALKKKKSNMGLLIALGTTAAYLLSLINWLGHLSPHVYFDSGAIIITFTLLGKWLELLSEAKTPAPLEKLLQQLPTAAWLVGLEHMIEKAHYFKTPVQSPADQASVYYLPAIVLISAFTWLFWAIAGQGMAGLLNAASVLFIACPCALGLAAPVVILTATGIGSRYGILFKQGAAFVRASRLTHIFLDKIRILIQDEPMQETIEEVLAELKQRNIELIIVPDLGDKRAELGLLEKIALMHKVKQAGNVVGMAGGSVDDLELFCQADVSFSHGMNDNLALEAASDIVIARENLLNIVDAIDLARAAMHKIRQNVFFALIYNILTLPLAAMGLLNPFIVAGTITMSLISVIANALFLSHSVHLSKPISGHQ
jgi:cation transport ATPase